MTLPSLIMNYRKKQVVSQLKKSYSVLEQTIKMAEKDNGPVNDWAEWDDAEEILNKYFKPYLSGSKVYPASNTSKKSMCYEVSNKVFGKDNLYNWLDGVYITSPFSDNNTASIKLADGSCIGLNNNLETNYAKNIFIDINGSQTKPNIAGKDLFFFYVNEQGFIKPYGDTLEQEELTSPSTTNSCNQQAKLGGFTCAARIMSEGWEINYWNN